MCGIVGYLGNREAAGILFDGLLRLEYRGYDSAGLAVVGPNGELERVRQAGNLEILKKALDGIELQGTVGVGHTRWATHGAPTEANAHPHVDCEGKLALVHNGIIENFAELREGLIARGHTFKSDTDTEVVAHLLEEHYRGDLVQAMRECVRSLEGAYALVAVHVDSPGVVVGARKGSPLVLGLGEGEYFLASAVPAFLAHTRDVVYLENDEIVSMDGDGYHIWDGDDSAITRKPVRADWSLDAAEKGGYEDFMLKEIYEQPEALLNTIRDKIDENGRVYFADMMLSPEKIEGLRRIIVVACGTSYHAGLLAEYVFEKWAELPVSIEIASEFRYRNLVVGPGDLVLAISQSGETLDTLEGVREAKRRGALVIAMVNVVGSIMTREADGVIYTHAGPEIGVAATKTLVTQMSAIYLLAIYLGRIRGVLDRDDELEIVNELREIPQKMQEILERTDPIVACAQQYYRCRDFLFIGRGVGYPIAMEAALKLKEISYIHAEGHPAGEMKHGPIALLDGNVPVVAIVVRDSVFEKMLSNIQEAKARNAPVVAVATEGDEGLEEICDFILCVPPASEMLNPLLTVVVLQLLAYHIAKMRGCNVDQPRNLAKTVTVE